MYAIRVSPYPVMGNGLVEHVTVCLASLGIPMLSCLRLEWRLVRGVVNGGTKRAFCEIASDL